MKISIIIPVFNTPISMLKCLFEHIQSSTTDNLNFIFINDGSEEKCSLYLRTKCLENNFALFEFKKNVGVSCARNKGIELANTENIMFLDSDDILNFNLINSYNYDKGNDIVFFKDAIFFDEPKIVNKKSKEIILDKTINQLYFSDDYRLNLRSSCCKILKKSIIVNNGIHFDEELKFYEDAMFMSEYYQCVHKFIAVDNILYYYRLHSESSSKTFNKNYFIFYSKFFDKYKYKFRSFDDLISALYKDTFTKVIVDKFVRSFKKLHFIFCYKIFKEKCVIESSNWALSYYKKNDFNYKLANAIVKKHLFAASIKLILHRISLSISIKIKKLLKK